MVCPNLFGYSCTIQPTGSSRIVFACSRFSVGFAIATTSLSDSVLLAALSTQAVKSNILLKTKVCFHIVFLSLYLLIFYILAFHQYRFLALLYSGFRKYPLPLNLRPS